jgi:hypothetical protein
LVDLLLNKEATSNKQHTNESFQLPRVAFVHLDDGVDRAFVHDIFLGERKYVNRVLNFRSLVILPNLTSRILKHATKTISDFDSNQTHFV